MEEVECRTLVRPPMDPNPHGSGDSKVGHLPGLVGFGPPRSQGPSYSRARGHGRQESHSHPAHLHPAGIAIRDHLRWGLQGPRTPKLFTGG